MQNISVSDLQYRQRNAGDLALRNRSQLTVQQQNQRALQLADRPGRHHENRQRRGVTNALLLFLTHFSSVKNSHMVLEKSAHSALLSAEYSASVQRNVFPCNTDAEFMWGEKFAGTEQDTGTLASSIRPSSKTAGSQLSISCKNAQADSKKPIAPENNYLPVFNMKSLRCLGAKCGTALSRARHTHDEIRAEQNSSENYPLIARGSISRVHDTGDGMVIKHYHGVIDSQHTSRLKAAINNVKGFNRLYGNNAATVIINPNLDGSARVSTRLKKIVGLPLGDIILCHHRAQLEALAQQIKSSNIALLLSERLQKKGITHDDINMGNIIFSHPDNFYIIDFDRATFMPEGMSVSAAKTQYMCQKFTHVLNESLRAINQRLSQL